MSISTMLSYCCQHCEGSILSFVNSLSDYYDKHDRLSARQIQALENVYEIACKRVNSNAYQ